MCSPCMFMCLLVTNYPSRPFVDAYYYYILLYNICGRLGYRLVVFDVCKMRILTIFMKNDPTSFDAQHANVRTSNNKQNLTIHLHFTKQRCMKGAFFGEFE